MRGLVATAVGLFGLVAYLRRRRGPATPEIEPADELRARLAETRAVAEPASAPEAPVAEAESQPAPDVQPEAESDAVSDRRQDVHDRARAAIDELG